MAIPPTRQALLAAITKNFAQLLGYLNAIPAERSQEKTLPGHAKETQMSVQDLVAYLLGWNRLVIKWITRQQAGQPVDFPETGYKWNQLGALAQKFYDDYAGVDYQALIEQLQTAKNDIVALIEARTDQTLYGAPWYGKWTLGRMISFNTSSPYANAGGRLRKWARVQQLALK